MWACEVSDIGVLYRESYPGRNERAEFGLAINQLVRNGELNGMALTPSPPMALRRWIGAWNGS